MTFWGVEVKPGAPVTHSEKARLRLTRATLGSGNGTKKSIVQCNVGKKSPVIICSLFPGKFESCTLSLQYEEADDVVFSVIGPHSVHLTGYYMEPVHGYNPDDESESYGEDIGEADTEKSGSDEHEDDEYEDSFINDDDPNASPAKVDKMLGKKNSGNENRKLRRLRKKCHLSESDKEDRSLPAPPKLRGIFDVSDSEDEDTAPLTHILKGRNTNSSKGLSFNVDEGVEMIAGETKNQEAEDNYGSMRMSLKNDLAASLELGSEAGMLIDTGSENVRKVELREAASSKSVVDNLGHPPLLEAEETVKNGDSHGLELQREIQEVMKDIQLLEVESSNQVKIGDALQEDGVKIDYRSKYPSEGGEENLEKSSDKVGDFSHNTPPPKQLVSKDGEQKKRKRKQKAKRVCSEDISCKEDNGQTNGPEPNSRTVDLPGPNEVQEIENVHDLAHTTQSTQLVSEDEQKKQKKKQRTKKVYSEDIGRKGDKGQTNGLEPNITAVDLPGHNESLENEGVHGLAHTSQSTPFIYEDEQKKQKKKQRTKKVYSEGIGRKEDKGLTNGLEPNIAAVDLPGHKGNLGNKGMFEIDANKSPMGSQHKERKKKMKKTNPDTNTVEIVQALPCSHKPETSVFGIESNGANEQVMHRRTLSNGIVIEELEVGGHDGRIAALGRKVSVRYVGKSSESGQEFYSNLDKAPLRFKLGSEVQESWKLGIDGMQVGGRRRIMVPPSMGSLGEGVPDDIPPDSWLEFDVELVKVQ